MKIKGLNQREEFHKKLDQKIRQFWESSHQTYGAPRITADLLERALRMAHTLCGQVPEGVVFHADRGTQ